MPGKLGGLGVRSVEGRVAQKITFLNFGTALGGIVRLDKKTTVLKF